MSYCNLSPPLLWPGMTGLSTYRKTPCSRESCSSYTASTMSSSQVARQHMEDWLQGGVKDATFQVDLTAEDAVFYADPNKVQAVIGHLQQHHNLTNVTLLGGGPSSESSPRFPSGGFCMEKDSYDPLMHLLNKVVYVANECLRPAPRYLKNLRFYRYEGENIDTRDSIKRLKPDGVGLLRYPSLPSGREISWEDVEIAVKAKREIHDLILQSAMGARSSLVHDRRRLFATTIAFNHETLEIYFFVFHHSGLSSSHSLSLRTPEGFQTFVRHMVGILSIQSEADFGLDMTLSTDVFRINGRNYGIVRPIHMPDNLCGRATAVYSLSAHTTDTPHLVVSLQNRTLTLAKEVTNLPDKIVYKMSYPKHSQEGLLFSNFVGQFGVVDVVGFHVCGPEEPHGSIEHLFRNANFWSVHDDKAREPEERRLQCIAMSSEGQSLSNLTYEGGIPSPGDLLETILHAIIGHCILFFGGVLHRDISNGNVLRHLVPVKRPPLKMFPCTENVELCQGFVADGDFAIKWRKDLETQNKEISGTLPFMSIRLLGALVVSKKGVVHTAVDDLESFLWVFVWALVHILRHHKGGTKNPAMELLSKAFSSGSIEHIFFKEYVVSNIWHDAVFECLIKEWLDICRADHEAVIPFVMAMSSTTGHLQEEACGRLEAFCRRSYEKVLNAGYRHLVNIKQYPDWEVVATAHMG